jgi:hypothetical protein
MHVFEFLEASNRSVFRCARFPDERRAARQTNRSIACLTHFNVAPYACCRASCLKASQVSSLSEEPAKCASGASIVPAFFLFWYRMVDLSRARSDQTPTVAEAPDLCQLYLYSNEALQFLMHSICLVMHTSNSPPPGCSPMDVVCAAGFSSPVVGYRRDLPYPP